MSQIRNTMNVLTDMKDYAGILQALDMDQKGQEAAAKQVAASGITVNDGPVAFSYLPMIVDDQSLASMQEVIDRISQILDKMTRYYIESPEYRRIFGFSKEMEELICLPCDDPCTIPFGRYDLFYDFESGNYAFCEINTDGSGGMSWNDRVTEAILKNLDDPQYLKEEKLEVYRATEEFVKGIIACYQNSPQAVEDPLIAIVDFKEEGVTTDFDGILGGLQKAGIRARFTDIRNLKLETMELQDADSCVLNRSADSTGNCLVKETVGHPDNGKLTYVLKDSRDGAVIHGIYRRAVTSVVLERYEECKELIEAVRRSAVVLMGHFRTSLAHSKTVFAAMYHPETSKILTEEERAYVEAHIPATYILRDGLLSKDQIDEVRAHKDDWVLKPEEGFGSFGVCCGLDVSKEEWSSWLDDAMDKPYILQQFCPRYTIPVVRSGSEQIEEYPLMLGIFQANGQVAGCYNRAGKAGVIDYSHGCVCVGTVRKR